MTSVFSSIVLPRRGSSTSKRPLRTDQDDYNHIYDLASQEAPDNEQNTRELNNCLQVLVELFPDVQPDVFREMLTRVSPESRLEVVTEQLLKHDAEYIQGRYRRSLLKLGSRKKLPVEKRAEQEQQAEKPVLHREEMFRSETYKQSVKSALCHEFKSLSKAAIKAVLAENNYHYIPTRNILLEVSSKSWRASISNFFFRRKTPTVGTHPFLRWTPSRLSGRDLPRLTPTGNAELDQELYHALIQPAHQKDTEAQVIVDNALAHQVAEKDAGDAAEEYDCEVCYSTIPIHNVGVCDDGGHFICFRCISHTIIEAVYGQGWPRSISNSRGTMRCVALVMDALGDCKGCIPFDVVKLALADKEVRGEPTLHKFEQRLASNTLQDTGLPLAHCPFCSYAEVDDLSLNKSLQWRLRDPREVRMFAFWALLFFLATGGLLLLLPFLAIGYLIQQSPPPDAHNPLYPAIIRLAHKSRGLRFTCQSPACSKRSCLRCNSVWRDPHSCYSTQLSTLQKSVEAAQTAAIKRVCPKCDLSFVKSSGCNKLVCPCGYKMCYLCRAQIIPTPGSASGGYEHFCQHFRVTAGKCTQCDKCDLYREEDEKDILKAAREKAEQEWREGDGKDVTLKLDAVETLVHPKSGWSRLIDPSCWQLWLDGAVERLIVVEVD